MAPPSRQDVEDRWRHVIAGTMTREEVHAWAVPWVEGDDRCDDTMVDMALLELHGLDLTHFPGQPDLIWHGIAPGRVYRRSLGAVAARLDHWLDEIEDYDRDPLAWRLDRFENAHASLICEGRLKEAAWVRRFIDNGLQPPPPGEASAHHGG